MQGPGGFCPDLYRSFSQGTEQDQPPRESHKRARSSWKDLLKRILQGFLVGGLNPKYMGWLSPIYGKIKSVSSHQPVLIPWNLQRASQKSFQTTSNTWHCKIFSQWPVPKITKRTSFKEDFTRISARFSQKLRTCARSCKDPFEDASRIFTRSPQKNLHKNHAIDHLPPRLHQKAHARSSWSQGIHGSCLAESQGISQN